MYISLLSSGLGLKGLNTKASTTTLVKPLHRSIAWLSLFFHPPAFTSYLLYHPKLFLSLSRFLNDSMQLQLQLPLFLLCHRVATLDTSFQEASPRDGAPAAGRTSVGGSSVGCPALGPDGSGLEREEAPSLLRDAQTHAHMEGRNTCSHPTLSLPYCRHQTNQTRQTFYIRLCCGWMACAVPLLPL